VCTGFLYGYFVETNPKPQSTHTERPTHPLSPTPPLSPPPLPPAPLLAVACFSSPSHSFTPPLIHTQPPAPVPRAPSLPPSLTAFSFHSPPSSSQDSRHTQKPRISKCGKSSWQLSPSVLPHCCPFTRHAPLHRVSEAHTKQVGKCSWQLSPFSGSVH